MITFKEYLSEMCCPLKDNKGLQQEAEFTKRLRKHKLTRVREAGATVGKDFDLIDKRPGAKRNIKGEFKSNSNRPAYGQATIHHTPEKGWHIPDRTRKLSPEFSNEIESSGLLDRMNKHHPDPSKRSVNPKTGVMKQNPDEAEMKVPNVNGAKAYLRDKKIGVVHIAGSGTYRGNSEDTHNLGLPEISGTGRFNARAKHGNDNARTVKFIVHKTDLPKSPVNLENEDHIANIKNKLGHVK